MHTYTMSKGNKHARTKFRKWINSYSDVCSWMEKHGDLEQLLDENGGLVKIENFLPTFVAEGILELLEGISESTWNLTAAGDDYAHNNIRHEFLSVKSGPPGLEDVFRIVTLLLPDSLFTFSAAKYCKQGHIVPHDDRAYAQVLMDDGTVQLCSRSIACIYYLTKDWSTSDGGHLVDLEAPGGPVQHLPAFNSAVCFRIPRWHEVKPVTGDRPRYSIFGWFLEPGKLYDLNTKEAPQQEAGDAEQQLEQQKQQQPVGKKKSKKRKVQQSSELPGQLQEQQQRQQEQQQQRQPAVPKKNTKSKQPTLQKQLSGQVMPEKISTAAVKKKKQKLTLLGLEKGQQQQQQQQQQQHAHKKKHKRAKQ